jgi:hypothetical protein
MPQDLFDYLNKTKQLWYQQRQLEKAERREEVKEIHRWASIYYLYKITQEEWQAIFERQHGCCAICGVSQENLRHP